MSQTGKLPIIVVMRNTIIFHVLFLLAVAFAGTSLAEEQPAGGEGSAATPGKFLGAMETKMPEWFKESFLEFEDDIAEAADQGKRLILYFHQAGCPYCNKLINDNFADAVIGEKVRNNFDIVAINMWGDREVVQVGGQQFTEKTLAAALNVNFTPTLLFFSEQKEVALRLDGYYPSAEFVHALDYVAQKKEKTSSYAEYITTIKSEKRQGTLVTSKWTSSDITDLHALSNDKNLAVIFAEPDCETCSLLHSKVFQNESADNLLRQYHVVQFNRWSDQVVTTPEGKEVRVSDWANQLNLGFAPAMVLFNQQRQQVIVVDAMFKTFHVLGVFDYVASGAYSSEPSFQRYLSERAERIRHTGKDVDIWNY